MSAMPLRAQNVDQVATVPPNVVLSNYHNVPVVPFGGLEGSAYVARVGDPSAAWFNPAGLSRCRVEWRTSAIASRSRSICRATHPSRLNRRWPLTSQP
jgi:hypothetical protein